MRLTTPSSRENPTGKWDPIPTHVSSVNILKAGDDDDVRSPSVVVRHRSGRRRRSVKDSGEAPASDASSRHVRDDDDDDDDDYDDDDVEIDKRVDDDDDDDDDEELQALSLSSLYLLIFLKTLFRDPPESRPPYWRARLRPSSISDEHGRNIE